jgi:hypothetical protein
MNTYTKIIGLSVLVLSAVKLQAYTFTFNNTSEFDAEVQFKLAADVVAKFPLQTVKVPAKGSGSVTISEWWRAGLCIDLASIEIKFLPDGVFKLPWPAGGTWFDEVVQTKKMPKIYAEAGKINATAESEVNKGYRSFGKMFNIECSNAVIDITYHEHNRHPVIRLR